MTAKQAEDAKSGMKWILDLLVVKESLLAKVASLFTYTRAT
jgi:hypothetical protein